MSVIDSAIAELSSLSRARELCRTGDARDLRIRAHLTQAEIASRCGVSPAAISRWETGGRFPRGRAAEMYAAIVLSLETALGGASSAA